MNFDQTEYQHVTGTEGAEAQLKAYNAAFRALGLRWQWDADTYRELLRIPAEMERIGTYLAMHQANMLNAYSKEFLAGLIHTTKQRCEEAAVEPAAPPPAGFDDVH